MAEQRRPPTREEKLSCIKRELFYRRRVYEVRVQHGKMTKAQADKEIWLMEAIQQDYENSKDGRLL